MKKALFVAVFLALLVGSSPVSAQTLTPTEREALIADLREQLLALMNQLVARLQADMIANTEKMIDLENKQAEQDQRINQLGASSASEPVVVPPRFSRMGIFGSDNAFQVSLINHDKDYSGYKIISYPNTLKRDPDSGTVCEKDEGEELCNTRDYFIPLAVPAIRDDSYDLPDDNTLYKFTVEIDGKEYKATLKKGEDIMLVDNS